MTDVGAWFTTDIRGCTDDSTRTSVFTDIQARTVRPGKIFRFCDTKALLRWWCYGVFGASLISQLCHLYGTRLTWILFQSHNTCYECQTFIQDF